MSSQPTAALWPGAFDCHLHVFEDSYPLATNATFQPPHAPAALYRSVQQSLGISRAVVVQPTGYGYDNRCTLDAMRQLGPGTRGIAVVPPDAPDAQLHRLNQAGMRGVRYMMLPGGVLGWDTLPAMAARIAPLGWNINLQLDGRTLPEHESALLALPSRLVIDHIGKFLGGSVTSQDAAFRSLRRLLERGQTWVKISAPYESSHTGAPAYADVTPLARALIENYPDRCLWASNWPHPNVKSEPSNQVLWRWFFQLTSEAVAKKILVDNAAEVYDKGANTRTV